MNENMLWGALCVLSGVVVVLLWEVMRQQRTIEDLRERKDRPHRFLAGGLGQEATGCRTCGRDISHTVHR